MATKEIMVLLNAVSSNQTSQAFRAPPSRKWIQASITGTGAITATVTWFGNSIKDNTNGVLLATSTLSGTTTDTTGADMPGEPKYMYCVVSAISGTGAAVTCTVSI
jgi:hypothetical protein